MELQGKPGGWIIERNKIKILLRSEQIFDIIIGAGSIAADYLGSLPLSQPRPSLKLFYIFSLYRLSHSFLLCSFLLGSEIISGTQPAFFRKCFSEKDPE